MGILNEVMDMYGRWKNAVEGGGLRANALISSCLVMKIINSTN